MALVKLLPISLIANSLLVDLLIEFKYAFNNFLDGELEKGSQVTDNSFDILDIKYTPSFVI